MPKYPQNQRVGLPSALFVGRFRGPSAQTPFDNLPQGPVGRFPERSQLLQPALLQDLRLRLVGYLIRKFALGNKQGLFYRPALFLMRTLLAFRDVLTAALLVLAIGVA